MKATLCLTVCTGLLGAAVVTSCNSNEPQAAQENLLYVTADTVQSKMRTLPVRSIGRLVSKKQVKMSFKTGGLIESVRVSEGDRVRKGQVLARLKMDEVSAHYRRAELALEKAARDLGRIKNLYADSVATLEQYQDMKTAYDLAEEQLNIAAYNRTHSVLKAAGNGLILKQFAEEGEMAAPGYPVLLYGLTQKEWRAEVAVTDAEVVRLSAGDSAIIHLDAWPDSAFNARITEINNMADPYSGTFGVELQLYPVSVPVRPGMILRTEIYPSDAQKFLMLPVAALTTASGNTGTVFLWQNGKAKKSAITIHHMDESYVWATSGIQAGDIVLTAGAAFINENSKVILKNPAE